MTRYKIEVIRDCCVGDGLCCDIAPKTFKMDDEDRCVVVDPAGDPPEDILRAAEECLTDAIVLVDAQTGERVCPRGPLS